MARRVAVVPHTHWDREWYVPFPTFRARLVDTLDALLATMEADPAFRTFLLDGQMAMVDDYLEVRPEAAPTLAALGAAGRLTFGPWYVLPDEFLVTGETLVRNLQLGVQRAAAFGGAMAVGYLPDMFGHIGQMPQLLRQAGIAHAVVWRGVPAVIDKTEFTWEAPDGSTVRAEYLPAGYAVGSALPDEPEALLAAVRRLLTELEPFLGETVLLLAGNDHEAPRPGLGRAVAEANASQDEIDLELTSLPAYLAGVSDQDRPHWRGELRSGARANLLMGVASNRIDVKQAAARCHRELERRAEPYDALFGDPSRRTGRILELAWKQAIRNAAHDSICACSVDDVVDAVLGRYHEATATARAVADRALADLASSLAEPGPVVVNPSPHPRSGVVVATVADPAPPGAVQDLVGSGTGTDHLANAAETNRGALLGGAPVTVEVDRARQLLALVPTTARLADDSWIQAVELTEDGHTLDVSVVVDRQPNPDLDPSTTRQTIEERLAATACTHVRIEVRQLTGRPRLVFVGPVPGFGWAPVAPTRPEHPVTVRAALRPGERTTMTNDLVSVEVDASDGTFALDGLPGFGRLVDGGDLGDSYNYSPPPNDAVVDRPVATTVEVLAAGPLVARVAITATFQWPRSADEATGTRIGLKTVDVHTTVTVRADEPFVRVHSRFQNPSADHRVRVHLPLPEPAAKSRAECAFGVVDRPLTAEGRPDELGLPTFPSQRFVQAGGLTVVHDGLPEYELVDVTETPAGPQARTLALTVLRATSMLSRVGMAYRPVPAGPLLPVPGLQLLGREIHARYAVATTEVDPFAMAEAVLLPLEVVEAQGGGWRPASGQALSVLGAPVTAVRRRPGGVEVRLHNPTPVPVSVDLAGRRGWLVDLLGQPQSPVIGQLVLGAHAIATLWLDDPAADGRADAP
jgi:mannosylglycerate hydrolase